MTIFLAKKSTYVKDKQRPRAYYNRIKIVLCIKFLLTANILHY